jgi:hypothetical protein
MCMQIETKDRAEGAFGRDQESISLPRLASSFIVKHLNLKSRQVPPFYWVPLLFDYPAHTNAQ